jgi:hypothetical protein
MQYREEGTVKDAKLKKAKEIKKDSKGTALHYREDGTLKTPKEILLESATDSEKIKQNLIGESDEHTN